MAELYYFVYYHEAANSYYIHHSHDNELSEYGVEQEFYFAGFTRFMDAKDYAAALNKRLANPAISERL